MKNAFTRGQDRALAQIDSMIAGPTPHAVVFVGPASSGKTTLALDLAAGLLCTAPDPADRPCRVCRACRMVASGNHPDLHRLAPEGPGGQVRIGTPRDPEPGTVRHLIGELALLPVEGGARVAIVEQAHRLNEDAQNALLKLLEEPPPNVTIVLCADDEECLLPTVRSRCVRVRLSAVASREIERWLAELELADAPRAARLARLAQGRPGLALAYARAGEAERLRGEIARGLLDMLRAGCHERLTAIRELIRSCASLDSYLAAARADRTDGAGPTTRKRSTGRKADGSTTTESTDPSDSSASDSSAPDSSASDSTEAREGGKTSPAGRRAAAALLMEVWAAIGRDLAVSGVGADKRLRELNLIDEIREIAPLVSPASLASFMAGLADIASRQDDNLNPELALDVLALAWPRVETATAGHAPTGAPAAPAAPAARGRARP